jgi:hypothetical protein
MVLTSCLLCGCARSGIIARGADPSAAEADGADAVALREDPATQKTTAEFRFPGDRGGELLSKVLRPDTPYRPVQPRTEARRPAATAAIDSPSLLPPPNPVTMPRLPATKANTTLAPRPSLPETLAGVLPDPSPPHALSLPPGELTRRPSVDVNHSIPVPVLGQPLPDRAPVEDVTTDASSAAAIAVSMPQRTHPAPFVKNNLPDPFEFRRPVVVPPTPPDQPKPPEAAPRLPK